MSDHGAPTMDTTRVFFLLLFLSHTAAQQQPPTTTTTQPSGEAAQPLDAAAVSYRPRIAVVVGIFSIMLSAAFLLFMYTRFCYSASRAADLFGGTGWNPDLESHQLDGLLPPPPPPCSSGVDKAVIESLPFFRFSSLKGSREGMECAVCLSRFDGGDLLRLLPKCNHAFHVDCVDRWLEGHSSCPLCRRRVDLNLFKYSTSSSFLLRDAAGPAGEADLELYVERAPAPGKEVLLAARGRGGGGQGEAGGRGGRWRQEQFHDRLRHRILVSDVVFKNRWSDLNSSDLVSLNSEMLRSLSSRRFPAAGVVDVTVNGDEQEKSISRPDLISKIKEEMKRKRSLESKAKAAGHVSFRGSPSSSDTNSPGSTLLDLSANSRAMSEIINIPRFADGMGGSRGEDAGSAGRGSTSREEEKVRRVWLPIARRTAVKWSTAREKRSDSDRTTAGDDVV